MGFKLCRLYSSTTSLSGVASKTSKPLIQAMAAVVLACRLGAETNRRSQ